VLGVTEVSVTGRYSARSTPELIALPGTGCSSPLPGSEERDSVDRFTTAFAASDLAGVDALLSDDALLTMHPG
jgi:hypothetical protein